MHIRHDKINIYEAKTHFSQLVNAASGGREIIITKEGKPVAKLVPLKAKKSKVRFGVLKGKMTLAGDFDAALPDVIIDLFEGK